MTDDELGTELIGCVIKVHSALGPGLLESVYEICLLHELKKSGLSIQRQVPVPIRYDGLTFDETMRLDLLLDDRVIVELKCAEKLLPIHTAQLLTYLKLTGLRVGYLVNFNVVHVREGGIKRIVNG